MAYADYSCLRIAAADGVVRAVIDHPPINLLDLDLIRELDRLGCEVAADPEARVLVLASADPDFFIAHADVALIQMLPDPAPPPPTELPPFHRMVERFRTMPQATIAEVAGIARGGGSEVALSCDMRFAALGRARFAQPEVALGIIPGGSGTQRLTRLVGRARALEAILGCDDVPADLAERWGWVNRAVPAERLTTVVHDLACRIASYPPNAIALAKRAVDAALAPVEPGLLVEADAFNRAVTSPAARERMAAFLAGGGQTRPVELVLDTLLGAARPPLASTRTSP